MIFLLDFGHYVKYVHVPDGYMDHLKDRKTDDLIRFEDDFFTWVDQHEEYIRYLDSIDGGMSKGYCYGAKDVLRYINEVILEDSEEKAYFTSKAMLRKEKSGVLYF